MAVINISFLFPAIVSANAKQLPVSPQWLGEWQVRWKNILGEQFTGSSRLSCSPSDRLLKEELSASADGNWDGWRGTTLAKFNRKKQTWHYAWQDNRGGYCDFIGQFRERVFSLQFVDTNGKHVKQRMIIRALSSKQVVWECEKYEGESWRKNWQIEYHRN